MNSNEWITRCHTSTPLPLSNTSRHEISRREIIIQQATIIKQVLINKWLIVDWIIRQKARLNKGGEWLNTDALLLTLTYTLASRDVNPAFLFYPVRYVLGAFLIRYNITQREQEILLKWLNPYMDGKLDGRDTTQTDA